MWGRGAGGSKQEGGKLSRLLLSDLPVTGTAAGKEGAAVTLSQVESLGYYSELDV